jgi:hypothetical protein
LRFQSPFGSSGLERIGLEPCGLELSQSIWLERAPPKGQENLDRSDQAVYLLSQDWLIFETYCVYNVEVISGQVVFQSARARSSQMEFEASLLAWILEVTWGPALEQQWDQQWIRNKHGFGRWQVRNTGGYAGPGGAKYQRLYVSLIIFKHIIILMVSTRP